MTSAICQGSVTFILWFPQSIRLLCSKDTRLRNTALGDRFSVGATG
ncbi:hypothetical protein [Nostoc sp.]